MANQCRVCGESIKVAIFRNEDYCCDDHRKVLSGEKTWLEVIPEAKLKAIGVTRDGYPLYALM